MISSLSRWFLALFFVVAGANHFLSPDFYLAMMPPYLPAHRLLVVVSGIAEILGGVGILVPRTRRLAGWGLLALLVAVFPANIQAALHGIPGHDIQPWKLWARLPLQAVLMWWVYRACAGPRGDASRSDDGTAGRHSGASGFRG